METMRILTQESIDTVLQQGGTMSWVLNVRRARACEYALLVHHAYYDQDSKGDVPHRHAFAVGRISEIIPSPDPSCPNRWLVRFDRYAVLHPTIPAAWGGWRFPIKYDEPGDVLALGIDLDALNFQPMPERTEVSEIVESTDEPADALEQETSYNDLAQAIAAAKRIVTAACPTKPRSVTIQVEW